MFSVTLFEIGFSSVFSSPNFMHLLLSPHKLLSPIVPQDDSSSVFSGDCRAHQVHLAAAARQIHGKMRDTKAGGVPLQP